MKMRTLPSCLAFMLGIACPFGHAETFVIVNEKNSCSTLTRERVSQIFTAKIDSYPDGKAAHAFDHGEEEKRNSFYRAITGKSDIQMKAYWSRLKFTGQGKSPEIKGSDKDVIEAVHNDESGIGYVFASPAGNRGVRVILNIP